VHELAVEVAGLIKRGNGKARGPKHHPQAFEGALFQALCGAPPHPRAYSREELVAVAKHFTEDWAGKPFAKGLTPERLFGRQLDANVALLEDLREGWTFGDNNYRWSPERGAFHDPEYYRQKRQSEAGGDA
jgi:hypothetical protein